ncbi:MAG: efflux RND transporter periplasmic adaptor subunit [Bacteroidales bacterium]|nr:efflux RND transporter periplasmic adaptor subunit [Bacteroidales bacterium]
MKTKIIKETAVMSRQVPADRWIGIAGATATLAVGVMAMAMTLTGCGRGEEETGPRIINVQTQVVENTGDVDAKSYVGTVRPSKSTVLTGKYSGTLTELKVSQGQKVSKGEVIAVIESESVKSSLEMVQAKLDQARDGYERLQKVYDSGSVPEVKMVEIRTRLAEAEAGVKIAQQALDDCTIKAPYSGVISEVYTDEGVELSIAEPIVKIVDINSLEITIPVPESEIGNVSIGKTALMTVPALNDKTIECRITKKGVWASPLSHSYECTLKPSSDAAELMPGMVSKVRLGGSGQERIVIPASAVKTGTEGRYVWTVVDGEARRVDIEVDGFAGSGVVVTSGLHPGDRLIVSGAQKVSNGMKVNEVE